MKKSRFNAKLREYSRTLSPTEDERNLVERIYGSFNDLLGINNCIQIGSYPRFTSITPAHDLDILYILGGWEGSHHDPSEALNNLLKKIQTEYSNPTSFDGEVSLQTHSVTVTFYEHEIEKFSVDIVPAYIDSTDEFGGDTYMVPEILNRNHKKRKEYYSAPQIAEVSWILSDPRGYISVATQIGLNADFRKTVKFVKRWKHHLAEFTEGKLKLKSFHVEQVITKYFQVNQNLEIFDAVYKFFIDLPNIIDNPNRITDRVNPHKFIDDYLAKFSAEDKQRIKAARDNFLIILERMEENDSIEDLMDIYFYERPREEEFLFDRAIPVFKEPEHADFNVVADITDKDGNAQRRLNSEGIIDSKRYLKFSKTKNIEGCSYKWKVRNDDHSEEPRGEITNERTKNSPENTRYSGQHYVECYAIKDNQCVAVGKQKVIIP